VIDAKLRRRHMSGGERAIAAAKLANLERGDNQHAQMCASSPISQSNAADMLDVSRRSGPKRRQG
jgi:hypothetical protein